MATPPCHCAAFCRPVFDPGGSPTEKLSSHILHRPKTPVSALLFSINLQPPRNKPSEYQDLSRNIIELGSPKQHATDTSISVLLDRGHLDQLLHVLLVMYAQGIVPHLYIYWSYLKACNQRNALVSAKRLHAHLVLHGLEFVSSLSDYFLSTLFKCGGFELAMQVFHMLPHRTVFTWKAVITGYIDYGLEQEAIALYEMMLQDDVEPDRYVYVSLMRVCACLLDLHQGKALHADAQERFLHLDAFVGSALIYMYGKCKSIREAENVFEVLWLRDVVSWNAMLSLYVEQSEARKALQLYRQMNEEGPRPNNRTFVAAISACCILGENQETVWMCLAIGEALHSDARKMGFDSDAILSNNLMSMYGKCGSITKVQGVFNEMSHQSVVSWTMMLNAYLKYDQAETTLQLYRQMQEEGVCPDERIFMVALQACCSLAKKEEPIFVEGHWIRATSLTIGRALHYDAKSNSFDSSVFVSSTLMGMYGMCGRIMEAENVFFGLSRHNLVSFNAMLSVYIEQGEGETALRLYRQMKEEGVQSDERTTTIALQACCILAEKELPIVVQGRSIKVMSLDIGRSLHSDALRDGFGLDLFLSYTLLSMYRQCGSFEEAKNLASGPIARSSMYWTEMLLLYVEEGENEKALQLFKYMQDEGDSPNKWSFVMAIQACCAIAEKRGVGAISESALNVASLIGEALRVDTWKQGFSSDIFIGSTLLTLYSMCGDIVEAENVFAGLLQPDIVSWNAMLSAYLEQGDGDRVLWLYRNLQNESVCQNEGTFVAALRACSMLAGKEGAGQSTQIWPLEIGKALHADARKKGLDSLSLVFSALIIMYSRCGSMMDAESMFAGLVQHDIVSWTAMLSAYVEHGEAERALQMFRHIQKEGMTPDEQTFVSALEACAKLAESEEAISMEGQPVKVTCLMIGWALHADCLSLGYDSHDIVHSTLVNVYGKCKNLVEAEITFDRLPQQNIVLWNTMLSTYVDHVQGEKALHLYRLLQDVGVLINEFTLVCVLQACSLTGNVETCRQVHYLIECVGYNCCDNLRNILTHAYGSCASIVDCRATFDSVSQPDVVSWNALISGYVRQGKDKMSFQAFAEMQHAGIISNRVTALLLLSVCSHAGKVDRGLEYFESMFKGYGIIPNEEHYESMIDLLCRAGDFTKVKDVLSKEAVPSLSISLSLLGACQNHGSMALGSWAFDWSMHMQPKQAQAYIMMSNIHAAM